MDPVLRNACIISAAMVVLLNVTKPKHAQNPLVAAPPPTAQTAVAAPPAAAAPPAVQQQAPPATAPVAQNIQPAKKVIWRR